jgi:hypothetical protein
VKASHRGFRRYLPILFVLFVIVSHLYVDVTFDQTDHVQECCDGIMLPAALVLEAVAGFSLALIATRSIPLVEYSPTLLHPPTLP